MEGVNPLDFPERAFRLGTGVVRTDAKSDPQKTRKLHKQLHAHRIPGSLQAHLNEKLPITREFAKALWRTRTADPLLTMEVLCQLS